MTSINATQGVVFPWKRVSLGDIFQKKRGLVIFGGTFLKCAGTIKLSVFCLISRFLDQESSWSTDQVTGVYIYRRKRVSVLMTLINATQGVVFPRKRVSLGGYLSEKTGLGYFWGNILKMCRNNKLSVFCLISCFLDQESIWSADKVTGVYIYHPQNKADNTKYMTIPFIPLINSSFTE